MNTTPTAEETTLLADIERMLSQLTPEDTRALRQWMERAAQKETPEERQSLRPWIEGLKQEETNRTEDQHAKY